MKGKRKRDMEAANRRKGARKMRERVRGEEKERKGKEMRIGDWERKIRRRE